jgi:hypothetical protein
VAGADGGVPALELAGGPVDLVLDAAPVGNVLPDLVHPRVPVGGLAHGRGAEPVGTRTLTARPADQLMPCPDRFAANSVVRD